MVVMIAVGATGALATGLGILLVVAGRRLHVDEDPRIDVVEGLLPHANCGACGFPGCRAFAEAVVSARAKPGSCTVGTAEGRKSIATYLGVDVGAVDKRVARLACAGGSNVSRHRAAYHGLESCAAAALVSGGGKGCSWGCLGLADCAVACKFDAITMDAHGLPVVDEDACTACGDCVVACPKDLFSIHPAEHRLWVACRSHAAGDVVLEDCQVACTACGKCAMDAPGVVIIQGNLAVVDYSRLHATRVPTERCPTGAIVWIDRVEGPVKGPAARAVVRIDPMPMAST